MEMKYKNFKTVENVALKIKIIMTSKKGWKQEKY